MREAGSAGMSVAVSPSSSRPYFGSRGRYLVTMKRRPHDLVPIVGACSVAVRMFSWLRASAASATPERAAFLRHSCTCCSQRPTAAAMVPETLVRHSRSQHAVSVDATEPTKKTAAASVRRRWEARSRALAFSRRLSSRGSRTTAVPQSGRSVKALEEPMILLEVSIRAMTGSGQFGKSAIAPVALPRMAAG